MRTFQHFNQHHGDICPICGTNEDKETLLIPIAGTEEENIAEAVQVHADCLQENLVFDKTTRVVSIPIIYATCQFKTTSV